MKKQSVNFVRFTAAMGVILSGMASASLAQAQVRQDAPPTRLEEVLGTVRRQAVKPIDRGGLELVLNDRMNGVLIEGWSTRQLTVAESEALFRQFGIRVVANAAEGTAAYLAPSNVGRAGILEGDVYFRMDGKVYRGLTLKGYGGNTVNGHQEQAGGSLDFDESLRDMEMSTILAEQRVDTYVGVLSVKRPATVAGTRTTAGAKSNYVRLSRTALRMEDFLQVSSDRLPRLVEYMTDLLREEVGHQMSIAEFSHWLATKTGDLMARKDYIRFQHASITDSNLGIGELVDLGDTWNGAGMRLPGEYRSQSAEFFQILDSVHRKLKTLDPAVAAQDLRQLYEEAYRNRISDLRAIDAARVNLNRATITELMAIGFTSDEAASVFQLNRDLPDGIVDPAEVRTIRAISRDVTAVLERATTDFLRLSDGTQLGEYYVRNVGGAEGVRSILEETRQTLRSEGISVSRDASGRLIGDVARAQRHVERIALAQAERAGFTRAVTASGSTNLARFIATQVFEVMVRR